MTNFAIAFLFSSVLFLIIFVLFSILNYKNRFKMNYDLRNHYPYELNYEMKFSDNLVGNLAICLFAASGIAFYTLFDSKYTNGFLLFDLIAGSIYSLVLMSFAFISLNKHLKFHLLVVLIGVVLSFLIPFSNAMTLFNAYKSKEEVGALVLAIFNVTYCLIIFFMMMNPRLSHWADLKEEKDKDGTIKYVRPKYFILAFIEWGLILSSPLLMVMSLFTQILVY